METIAHTGHCNRFTGSDIVNCLCPLFPNVRDVWLGLLNLTVCTVPAACVTSAFFLLSFNHRVHRNAAPGIMLPAAYFDESAKDRCD